MLPPALVEELEDELDREDDDDEDRSDVVGLELELELALVEDEAVFASSSLPSSRNSATPIAASTTTPATIRAMSVFLLPFGC
jgi:hypothetical protein